MNGSDLIKNLELVHMFQASGLSQEEAIVATLLSVASDIMTFCPEEQGDRREILRNIGLAQRFILARVGNRRFQEQAKEKEALF